MSGDEKNTIKSTASAQYTGPKTAMDLGDSYSRAAKATQTAAGNIDNSGTEQGRMNLISQVNSKPRTQGMNVFDNTLLQAGGGREKLAAAAGSNQDVKGALDSTSAAIQNQAGEAENQTKSAQAEAYKSVQDALGNWKSQFNQKAPQAQQQFIDMQNRITGDLGNDQLGLDQETMDALGLAEGERIFGSNLSDYLKPGNPADINSSNVASAEDYARYGALADLAGEQDLMLNPSDSSKAGTSPKFGADVEKLKGDIATKKAAFEDTYNNKKGILDAKGIGGTYDGVNYGNMTPAQIENEYLPYLKKKWAYYISDAYGHDNFPKQFITELEANLNKLKSDAGYNNVIKKNAGA